MGRRRVERTESVAGILEADIVEGRLTPGDRLEERSLAERFGVSRTPIREALRRLSAIGLVEEQGGQGCIVARITLPELFEMFELVNELERSAARFAAQRISPESGRAITEAAQACLDVAANGDPLSYSRANLDFHASIHRASRNRFLEGAIRQVSARAALYRRQALTLPDWAVRSAEEHAAIAEAITARDDVRAAQLMETHINIFARKDFPRFVVMLSEQIASGQTPGQA